MKIETEDVYECYECKKLFTLMELGFLGTLDESDECSPFVTIVPICLNCHTEMDDGEALDI